MIWRQTGPAALAAFLASLVEFVEALTLVLAVGVTRGWRPALAGAAGGAVALVAATLALGPALALVPLAALRLAAGLLLLLFGLSWLRKAILRGAGILPLHDEGKIFARETQAISGSAQQARRSALDPLGTITAFKAVVIEGLEVVFIVITVGSAGRMFLPAGLGADAAGILVILLGVAVRKPLTRIPENTLKLGVGVLLTAFGIYWLGEGLGYPWPAEDWAVLALAAAVLVVSMGAVPLARRLAARRSA